VALGLALIQGGFITEFARDLLVRMAGGTPNIVSTDYQGFSLRASPAIPSGHFGPLSLLIPGQLVILLAELGPALLLAPAAVLITVRKVAGKDLLFASLAAGSILSFVFPIFFRYGLDFNITRLTGGALWLWSVLAFPMLWGWMVSGGTGVRALAWAGYAIAVLGGVVLLGIQLTAIPSPVLSTFIDNTDARYARAYWDRLAQDAQVLDSTPERAVTLFGRASRAKMDVYHSWPDWWALIHNPDPKAVADAGYTYIYEDEEWWRGMTGEQHQALRDPCVRDLTIDYLKKDEFPRLLDVSACK
jgi:hypothetical protein